MSLVDGEVAGDLRASAFDGCADVGIGVYLFVKHDGDGVADVGLGEAAPFAGAF